MTGPADVAICVPCKDEASRVPALVAALAALDPRPGAIFALDDGSSDGTAQLLREAGISTLMHAQNRGLGAGRNTLWRRAERGGFSIVAFLDADVSPPVDYVAQVVAGFEGGHAGLGGQNLDLDPASWVDAWRGRFWPQHLGSERLEDAPMLVGACASYRVEALASVGGFDERHRSHGEDVDIGLRLRAGGHRLRYDPTLIVRHRRVDAPRDLVRSCYLHCREGMRATLRTPGETAPQELVQGMARKAVSAPAAAIVKRRDPREAALGLTACVAGVGGYLVGWARP